MILPSAKDAVHRAWLYRVLTTVADDDVLPAVFRFKGGTCAAMLGWLDRFSLDLDFDYVGTSEQLPDIRARCQSLFRNLGLRIDDESACALQFFMKYQAAPGDRNTLKVDSGFPVPHANRYEPQRFRDIDRVLVCQTLETAFANKLIACMSRHERTGSIAGRDIYDIHHFFLRGFRYDSAVIQERCGSDVRAYLSKLSAFVDTYVTQQTIDEDINMLLEPSRFRAIRNHLKRETLMFLRDELARLGQGVQR